MKNLFKFFLILLCSLLLIITSVTTIFAHSGRTDSSGGHRDNKNKSGLGSYHYHCGGYPAHLHQSGYCPYRDTFPARVEIHSDKTTLGIGEKVSISGTVYPHNACSTNIKWSCSDTSVASVYDGVITAKNYGTATISAETFNGKKATITITVKEITANKVSVSRYPESSDYYIGENFSLTASIEPENVDNPVIIWTSSDDKIATVSETGNVKLISQGIVEIKASASNGVFGLLTINVKEKCVESVEIDDNETDIFIGEEQAIKATIIPIDATYPDLMWTSENPSIVSVSENGVITAKSCGETIIKATSKNELSDSIVVRVKEIKATSIQIEGDTEVKIGNSLPLSAIFTPPNTTNQSVEWSINNPEIASIDANGVLTAFKNGTIKVIATTPYGIYSEHEVTVVPQITNIKSNTNPLDKEPDTNVAVSFVGISAVAGVIIINLLKRKKKK